MTYLGEEASAPNDPIMTNSFPTFSLALILTLPEIATAQCTYQVLHTVGTQTVGGSDVTVTSAGVADSNAVYCTETLPYFIGYSYTGGISGTGSYSFLIDPPVTGAMLTVSGTSESGSDVEHVRIFINGAHYAIPAIGAATSCDPLGVITPEGDIGPCAGCSVSGMGGLSLPGPIGSITVQDTVLIGAPAGSIFSLYLCGTVGIEDAEDGAVRTPFPNPATSSLRLPGAGKGSTQVRLLDVQGRVVFSAQRSATDPSPLDVSGLPRGAYVLELRNSAVRHYKVTLE